jgi:hypothetical protein
MPNSLEVSAMFDPELVETAAFLQRACHGSVISWSPEPRDFTATAGFVPKQAVVSNEPYAHGLLQHVDAVELIVSVGAPIDVGTQSRTDIWPSAFPGIGIPGCVPTPSRHTRSCRDGHPRASRARSNPAKD